MLRLRKGVAKFGGKKPNKAAIKLPLRDGDIERDDEAYKGHYFINANSTTAPQIVDRAVKPILDRSEVYSGCYARVSLNFYAFNSNGNKGIACGLGNIQKIRDGESLGGKTTAADDFGAVVDDDFLAQGGRDNDRSAELYACGMFWMHDRLLDWNIQHHGIRRDSLSEKENAYEERAERTE